MTSPGHIVIGGGTGFIGSTLCRILRNQGYETTIVSRMPGPRRMTWHDINRVGLPESVTGVVNLAGQNILDMRRRWTEGFKQNVWNSRVQTTCSLARAIDKAPKKPSVFVTISGVGIYDPDRNVEYTEDSRIQEFDFFSKLCIEWEKAAAFSSHATTRHVAVRCGVVLGRDGGMIKQLYLPFFFGLGGPVQPGNQYLPWIHITDIARLILFALQSTNISGVLNGVAPQQITNKEFSDAFAKALRRPAFIPVPKRVLDILLDAERSIMLTKGQRVAPKRTLSLGFKYTYPDVESACHEVVNTTAVKEL